MKFIRMAITKILTITMSKDVEKLELACADGTITLENSSEVS